MAGKTGTAQHPGGDPHAWFVGFAPAQNPTIVVAVIVLDGGSLGSEATGGRIAAPIARAVMQAALDQTGPEARARCRPNARSSAAGTSWIGSSAKGAWPTSTWLPTGSSTGWWP